MLLRTMTNHANSTKRLLLTSAGLSLAAIGSLAPSAEAFTYHLDFNALYIDGVEQTGSAIDAATHNQTDKDINDEWANWGIDISGINYRWNGEYDSTDPAAQLRLYDTSTRNGADGDLETGAGYGTLDQGNALIIQKHGNRNSSTPNDDANGGEINLDFFNTDDGSQKLVNFNEFTLIDVEHEESGGKGVYVKGYRDGSVDPVLDIYLVNLLTGFFIIFSDKRDKDRFDEPNFDFNNDQLRSYRDDEVGVTMYQEGGQFKNNSVFRFEIDDSLAAAQGLSQITYQ